MHAQGGIFALVGNPLQSHEREIDTMPFFLIPKIHGTKLLNLDKVKKEKKQKKKEIKKT